MWVWSGDVCQGDNPPTESKKEENCMEILASPPKSYFNTTSRFGCLEEIDAVLQTVVMKGL